jgi:predicted kinase
MTAGQPTLHMLCGKIAAGKSSLAARLGAAPLTVIVSEDKWMFPCSGTS